MLLSHSSLAGCGSPRALLHFLLPRFARLLCDNVVVDPSIGAEDVAAQRAIGPQPKPSLHVAAVAEQPAEGRVVVRQAPSRHLVPRHAPGENRRPEHLGIRHSRKVAVAQAQNVQRDELEVAQVAVW